MKNKIMISSIREIKSSFKRFLSLLIMSMLGVGVFVGINNASPNMTASLDEYYDNQNLYDIKLISTLGLTNNDISKLKNIKTIDKITGTYSKDILVKIKEVDSVIKFIGITNDINEIELKKGTLPKKENEILVEESLLKKNNLKINDYIEIIDDNTFNNKKLKIVGVVKSPLYIGNATISSNRGNTNIGTGKIDYYTYINEDSFNLDYYTEIYLTVKNVKKETTDSEEYLKLINNTINDINKIKKEREDNRYNEIYQESESIIKEEEQKGLIELNNAKSKLEKVKNKLDEGKVLLDNTKETLDKNKLMLDNTKHELDDNKLLLDNTNKQLTIFKETLDNSKLILNEEVKKYNITIDNIKSINNKFIEINENDNLLITKEDIIETIPKDSIYYNNLLATIDTLYNLNLSNEFINFVKDTSKINELIILISQENTYYKEIIEGINLYKLNKETIITLNESINELEQNEVLYQENLMKYKLGLSNYKKGYDTYLNYLKEYEIGINKYSQEMKNYNSNYNIYKTSLNEYYNSREVFNIKINDAYKELSKIEKCNWYIYDRLDDTDYSSFLEDGRSIENLAKVFPLIFFIVAVLISLISMSRMVEEDRIEIGTLKSLGFSNKHIRLKYILYSLLATLSGGIIGTILGFYLLPYYIWYIYKMLFAVEVYAINYNFTYIIIGIILALICICGTTLFTIKKVVKEKPSELMRPKAPASGKRVLLEKIPFIWNKISFSNKVTIRNLFRYKKRVLMTVVGILGCTSLILVGFGIRDAIVDIPDLQYKEIFYYDSMIYLTKDNTKEDINNLLDNEYVKDYVSTKMTTGTSDNYSVNLFVPEDEKNLKNILNIKDIKTGKKLKLVNNYAIISDKLSELTNTKVGEYITFIDSLGKTHKFKVSSICENYAGNYIFINKKTYENKIEEYSTNVVYVNLKDKNKENIFSKKLLENDNVMSVISKDTTVKNISDMLKTLDSVVVLLIFLSGALSFVVLYNLSFININERKREIATLKVLGFTNKEVDNYINKETIILTIIGIIFGLLFGILLTNFIVDTVEVDMVRFIRKINTSSFVLSAVITIIFTIVVNFITHFTLKKIDMVESLKSVE